MVSGDALMDTLMEELSEEEMVQLDVEVYRVMMPRGRYRKLAVGTILFRHEDTYINDSFHRNSGM